jgi:hypothetical protein
MVTKSVFAAQPRAHTVIRMSLCKHACIEVLCTHVVFGRRISPSSSDDMVGRDQHNPIAPASAVMLAFRRRGIGDAYAHPLMAPPHSSQRSDGCCDHRFGEGGVPNNHSATQHEKQCMAHTQTHVHKHSRALRFKHDPMRPQEHPHHLVTFTDQSPLPKGYCLPSRAVTVCTEPEAPAPL